MTNFYNTNYTNSGFGFRIPIYRSAFSIFSSSINFNARLLRNKPDFLFFIPNYFFIGPKYDALIGNDKLQLRNYLGFQYGFKYKFSLKYVNIYPSLTISQTPNLYIAAMNSAEAIEVNAVPSYRGGELHKLYIMGFAN